MKHIQIFLLNHSKSVYFEPVHILIEKCLTKEVKKEKQRHRVASQQMNTHHIYFPLKK